MSNNLKQKFLFDYNDNVPGEFIDLLDVDYESEFVDYDLDEISDMAKLGSLVLSYPDDLITDLFVDFLKNMEEKEK